MKYTFYATVRYMTLKDKLFLLQLLQIFQISGYLMKKRNLSGWWREDKTVVYDLADFYLQMFRE